jgi:surface protein
MKCPYCNGEHPDNYRFCPETGLEIVPQFKACTNEDCPDYGKDILPLEAKFCPRCGKPIRVEGKGRTQKMRQDANHSQSVGNIINSLKNNFVSHGSSHSQIVVVCSKAGPFIQIGRFVKEEEIQREKQLRLKKGENVISVKEYPELQYGFSFDIESDEQENIEDIILDKYDTSNVTDMSCMFEGCSSLKSLDLSSFDTSNVTNMSNMFEGCSSLKSLDLSGFDTSNVTEMGCMFDGCKSLESLDLSSFDTSNVTDMIYMFDGCKSLESLDLSGFDTSNVTDMSSMFEDCSALESLDLSSFDTSNILEMCYMFRDCSSLESLDLDGFDTSNASTDGMFDGCSEEIQEKYEYLL